MISRHTTPYPYKLYLSFVWIILWWNRVLVRSEYFFCKLNLLFHWLNHKIRRVWLLFLRPTIRLFAVYLRLDSIFIWYSNHDIVVGLCSELFMRLSYYIHLGIWQKAFGSHGDRPAVLPNESRLLFPLSRALTHSQK